MTSCPLSDPPAMIREIIIITFRNKETKNAFCLRKFSNFITISFLLQQRHSRTISSDRHTKYLVKATKKLPTKVTDTPLENLCMHQDTRITTSLHRKVLTAFRLTTLCTITPYKKYLDALKLILQISLKLPYFSKTYTGYSRKTEQTLCRFVLFKCTFKADSTYNNKELGF